MTDHPNPAPLSVIIPAYRAEGTIDRALASVAAQSIKPYEVIVVDDGSPDGTLKAAQGMSDSMGSIKLKIIGQENKGAGAARNRALQEASQEYVAFLDADDTWKPDKLKRIKELVKDDHEVNCLLHWEEYIRADGSVTILEHGINYDENLLIPKQLYRNNFLSTSAVVCNRSLLKEVGGFDASLPNGQDYDLWLKMSPMMKIIIIPDILGNYIEEATSITARAYHKRIRAEILILWRHREKGTMLLFLRKLIRILLSKQWFYTFRNLIFQKEQHSN